MVLGTIVAAAAAAAAADGTALSVARAEAAAPGAHAGGKGAPEVGQAGAAPGFKEPSMQVPPAAYADDRGAAEGEGEGAGEGPGRRKPRVVVLGTGWAAVSFLKTADTGAYDVVVVSPRNYFVFTPLLPSVTSGSVESRSIAEPIRRILYGRNKQAQFVEAECASIDPASKSVRCRAAFPVQRGKEEGEEFDIAYDRLVVAVGAETNTFGTPGVKENCHFLKEVEHAERIHQHIVDCFEAASLPTKSEEERRRLLSFVVVGGGPTGVEFAAELHDLIVQDLSRLYPGLGPLASITLVEAGDHILNMFDMRISNYAQSKCARDGVDVRVGQKVVEVTPRHVVVQDRASGKTEQLPHGGFVLWSTGIGTRPLMHDLMGKVGQTGRRLVATDEWLRVKGAHDVWALGDCATIEQRRMRDDIRELFQMADTDGDGMLDERELRAVLKHVEERYPQIVLYLRRKTFRDLLQDLRLGEEDDVSHISEAANAVAAAAPPQGDGSGGGGSRGGGGGGWVASTKVSRGRTQHAAPVRLSIDKFQQALEFVDLQLKSLPATAQVAAQQGDYLAKCFNKAADPNFQPEGPPRVRRSGQHLFHPFRYRHFGQFAPVGTGEAALELLGDWVNIGRSTQWLWYSVYASKQVSWRTRALVVFDWMKRAIFGRDSSRM